MQPWLAGAGVIAASMAAAYVLHALLFRLGHRVARRTASLVDDLVLTRAERPGRAVLMTLAVLAVLPMLPLPAGWAVEALRFAGLFLIAALGWAIISLSHVVTDWATLRYDLTQPDNVLARQVHTRVQMLRRVVVAVVGIITVLLMLMTFPTMREVGLSLFASAGIAGLVIGMAARPALSNLIAGIQLALTGPVRIGDFVVVEGESGTVEEITATYVVIRLWDQRRLVVPLSTFIEKPFQNWTRAAPELLGSVMVYLDHSIPIDEVRRQVLRILDASPLWDRRVGNLQMTEFKEQSVELRALVSAASAGDLWDLRCHLREELLKVLQQQFPQSLPRLRAELATAKAEQQRAAE